MVTPKKENDIRDTLTVAHHDFEKALNVYAFFKLHDHTIGEGLVQDTFVKTWSYLVRGGKIESMKAFLYHVLNDLIVDEYRKHKSTSLDALLTEGFEPKAVPAALLFDVLDGKATALLILQLPEPYRKIMRMRYVQDLSLKEMSLITGKSKNSLAVQVHRGLKKLKLLYEPKIEGSAKSTEI